MAIFAVPYSPNFGDGVIALSLASMFRARFKDKVDIEYVDISGRRGIEKSSSSILGLREYFILVAKYLPSFIRRFLVSAKVKKTLVKVGSEWEESVKKTDFVLIGGGNLMSDVDLNFPLKLNAIFAAAERHRKKVFIVSVGASDNWSSAAIELVKPFLQSAEFVSCRDTSSKQVLEKVFDLVNVHVLRDPALFLSNSYPLNKDFSNGEEKIFGVNISCPANLSYSGDLQISSGQDNHEKFYRILVNIFSRRGWRVVFFTNGAVEDNKFAFDLNKKIGFKYSLNIPKDPADLVKIVSGFDTVFSYRLHACIIALSYGKVAFSSPWDTKIRAIYQDLGLESFLIPQDKMADVDFLEEVLSSGISTSNLAEIGGYFSEYESLFKSMSK